MENSVKLFFGKVIKRESLNFYPQIDSFFIPQDEIRTFSTQNYHKNMYRTGLNMDH